MLILLLSGPNLNLLGSREPEIYGPDTLDDCVGDARAAAESAGCTLEHVQSNHEGDLVDAVQGARGRCDAIVVNPGALTHYSFSLADALASYDGVSIELHLSNPASREEWRRRSVVAPYVTGTVAGFGRAGYRLAIEAAVSRLGRAMTGTLAPMAVAGRAGRVLDLLTDAGADALLVTRLPNVRYLTGFTGSAGMLLVAPDGLVLVTDGRYDTQSHEQLAAAGVDARIEIAGATAQTGLLAGLVAPWRRLGLEAHGVTWAQQRAWATTFDDVELVATEELVEGVRRTKEPGEVARIRAACSIADEALADTLPMLAERPTERAFALALEIAIRERGASGTSFDTICASGPNAALPHARPTGRPVERGELVVIDFGCIVDGYCSDMTRTVSVGDPGPDATRLWDVVRASQQAGRDAVAPGVACAEVDRASRDVIEAAGWGDAFSHGTGHGVGLEIHEAPRVAKAAGGNLETGVVVTVEPGVYLPGIGGVRLEDTVVVTDRGADALTSFPKHLSIEAA